MNTQPRVQNLLTDSNGDGIQDSSTTLIFDDDGNQIAKYIDNDLDGRADYSLTSTYEYDDVGNLTITYFADNDGDGAIDVELPYVFDRRGVQLNQGGSFGSSRSNLDIDYTYDEAGNLVLVENRETDTITSFTYDGSGNQTSATSRSILTGELKSASTSEYNERGDIIRSTVDFDGDGVANITRDYAYIYDENGNVLSEIESGTSGPTITKLFTYDEAGNIVRESTAFGGGEPELVSLFTYDDDGNLIRQVEQQVNRPNDIITTYAYDAVGNRISESIDNDGDSVPDRVISTTYPDVLGVPDAVDDAFVTPSDILLLENLFDDNGSGVDQNPADISLSLSAINGEAVEPLGDEIMLPSGALLRVKSNGDFVYDPTEAFDALGAGNNAFDGFTYTVVNSVGITDTATASFTVEGTSFTGEPALLRQQVDYSSRDGFPTRVATYTYDANGNETSRSFDLDGDGSPESVSTALYDENGNKVRQTEDSDGDGQLDRVFTNTYDAAGNLISQAVDDGDDSVVDFIASSAYDAAGNLVRRALDDDADGVDDFITTNGYDEAGNLISSSTDSGGNGSIEVLATYSYDAFGNQTSQRQDFGADGVFERSITAAYSYDVEGRLVSESLDIGDDGSVEQTIRYSPYKIETEIGTDLGGGFFGNIVFRGTTDIFYDEQGRLSAEYIDINDAGIATRTVLYDYTEMGRTVRQVNDFERDGVADQLYTMSYDLAGNIIRDASDYDADGIEDEVRTLEYDDAGNLLVETYASGDVSDIDTATYYTYDAAGNQTSFSRDFTGDGVIDFAEVYTYDDFGNRLTEARQDLDSGIEIITQTSFYTGIPVVAPTSMTPEAQLTVLGEFYTYDAAGNLTITYDYDRDGDNTVDSKFSYTFDSGGSQIGEVRDYDADGTIDFRDGRSLFGGGAIAPQVEQLGVG